ncbi:hypothetical protein U3516DRAFT_740656 [Neocallimastix sp. 'constans']
MNSKTDTGGFEKPIKIGDKKSTFPTWENEVKSLLNHYPMDEYERIRIIMATVTDENYDLCSYDNTSTNKLDKLEKIRVQNNNIKNYNFDFKILLNVIEMDDRPTTKRIIQYYIRDLKGTRYYHSLVLKKFSSLDDAMKKVNKMLSSYEEYEESQNKNMKEVKIRSIIVIKHLIKIINSKIETETTLQTILQTILLIIHQITTKQIILKKKKLSKPKDNEKDSEVENLTEKFSKMQLYVYHRCGKPGHIASHCMNTRIYVHIE